MEDGKIYTSYYAAAKHVSDDEVMKISISRGVPEWFDGARCEALAPPMYLIAEAKKGNYDYYEKEYGEMLNELDADDIVEELLDMADDKHIMLLCYETPDKFCHRKLVSKWLQDNGYECEEYKPQAAS